MGPIGLPEMIAIFVIALVLFGPKKLPELGRMLGKGLREFRRAKSELTATFESQLSELEKETRMESNSASSTTAVSTSYTPSSYSYPYEADVPSYASDAPEAPSGAVARGTIAAATTAEPTPANEEHAV